MLSQIRWQPVSAEQAKQHPLYGVKSWLAVFGVAMALAAGRTSTYISDIARSTKFSYIDVITTVEYGPVGFLDTLLVFDVVRLVVVLGLMYTRHRAFRKVATMALIASWPVEVAAYLYWTAPEYAQKVVMDGFVWAIASTLWILYLHRSERVRVTFEHHVRLPDTAVDATATQRPFPDTSARSPLPGRVAPAANPALASHPAEPVLAATRPEATPGPAPSPDRLASFPGASLDESEVATASPSEQIWAQAFNEMESGRRRTGLWAQVFADHGGDLSATQAAYLRERAKQLQTEADALAAESAKALRIKQEAASSADAVRWAEVQQLRQSFLDGEALRRDQISRLARAVDILPDIATIQDSKWSDTVLHRCVRQNLTQEADILKAAGASTDTENAFGHWPYREISKSELRLRGLPGWQKEA